MIYFNTCRSTCFINQFNSCIHRWKKPWVGSVYRGKKCQLPRFVSRELSFFLGPPLVEIKNKGYNTLADLRNRCKRNMNKDVDLFLLHCWVSLRRVSLRRVSLRCVSFRRVSLRCVSLWDGCLWDGCLVGVLSCHLMWLSEGQVLGFLLGCWWCLWFSFGWWWYLWFRLGWWWCFWFRLGWWWIITCTFMYMYVICNKHK